MAFWSKKSISDILTKSFKADGISYKYENHVLSFEYPVGNKMLYPYITIDDSSDELSIVINIKKPNNKSLDAINSFNLNSRYFKACYKEDLIYLSYVFNSSDEVRDNLNKILGSLTPLIDDIQNLWVVFL